VVPALRCAKDGIPKFEAKRRTGRRRQSEKV
jgi:hypothetical protein